MTIVGALLEGLAPGLCAVCGAPGTARICGTCTRSVAVRVPAPQGLEECRSLGPYEGALGEAIRRAKYRRDLFLVDALGAWLGRSVADWLAVDAIVPVPVPPHRLLLRGFDQGVRLGRGVAEETGIEMRLALRRRWGERQVGKTASARRKLDHIAFLPRLRLKGARILLVDDVVTTGATMAAAAESLKRCGASHVWGLTVAHCHK